MKDRVHYYITGGKELKDALSQLSDVVMSQLGIYYPVMLA